MSGYERAGGRLWGCGGDGGATAADEGIETDVDVEGRSLYSIYEYF